MLWESLVLAGLLAATVTRWQRFLWQRDYHRLINRALSTTTPEACAEVARGWQALMGRTWAGTEARAVLRMYAAAALNGAGQHDEALAELDQIPLKLLGHDLLCLWLNNRAYALAHVGRTEEALDAINDAEEMRADDVTSPLFPHSCVPGTRGIVLFLDGQLDPAEASLRRALAMDEVEADDPLRRRATARLQAERRYWLAKIAERRGDAAGARAELERAAALPGTLFGARARRELLQGNQENREEGRRGGRRSEEDPG